MCFSTGRSRPLCASHAHPHPGYCVSSQSNNGQQPLLQPQLQAVSVILVTQESKVTQLTVVLQNCEGLRQKIISTLAESNPGFFHGTSAFSRSLHKLGGRVRFAFAVFAVVSPRINLLLPLLVPINHRAPLVCAAVMCLVLFPVHCLCVFRYTPAVSGPALNHCQQWLVLRQTDGARSVLHSVIW